MKNKPGKDSMQTTVFYHDADWDGRFCAEIARKFLPDAELIGWDFSDKPLTIPDGKIYVLDLPVDRVFGLDFKKPETLPQPFDWIDWTDWYWLDHHKTAIESHPANIPGYRIDGVAACRLMWVWCHANKVGHPLSELPTRQDFVDRKVSEPLAVRLAGTYDVWDQSNGLEDWQACLAFQFGLDSQSEIDWPRLLSGDGVRDYDEAGRIVEEGRSAMQCYKTRDAAMVKARSFVVEFEGLKFLALTTARCNSQTFAACDVPETGHDALMAFFFNGRGWTFSLYHAQHRKDLDLSAIATKYGGGGHKGACGFPAASIFFGDGKLTIPA
jgi:hypothetical protein